MTDCATLVGYAVECDRMSCGYYGGIYTVISCAALVGNTVECDRMWSIHSYL